MIILINNNASQSEYTKNSKMLEFQTKVTAQFNMWTAELVAGKSVHFFFICSADVMSLSHVSASYFSFPSGLQATL